MIKKLLLLALLSAASIAASAQAIIIKGSEVENFWLPTQFIRTVPLSWDATIMMVEDDCPPVSHVNIWRPDDGVEVIYAGTERLGKSWAIAKGGSLNTLMGTPFFPGEWIFEVVYDIDYRPEEFPVSQSFHLYFH